MNSEVDGPVKSVGPCDGQQVSVYLSFPQSGPDSINPSDDGGLLPNVPPSAMGGGFDPSLLNPAPSHRDQSPYGRVVSPPIAPVEMPSEPSAGDSQLPPHSPLHASPSTLHPEQTPTSPSRPADHLSDSSPDAPPTSVSPVAVKSPAPVTLSPEPEPEPEPEPIEVDREPTPHPDFHFSQEALAHLTDDFRNMTSLLNIEQLEQLRASCLGRVWAYRSDWDRDNLILELSRLLRDFVDEVRADCQDDEMLVSPISHP